MGAARSAAPTYVPGGYRADVASPIQRCRSCCPGRCRRQRSVWHPFAHRVRAACHADGLAVPHTRIGSPTTLIAMAGAYIEFPKTKADRERTKIRGRRLPNATAPCWSIKARARGRESPCRPALHPAKTSRPITEELGAQWDAIMGTPGSRGRTGVSLVSRAYRPAPEDPTPQALDPARCAPLKPS